MEMEALWIGSPADEAAGGVRQFEHGHGSIIRQPLIVAAALTVQYAFHHADGVRAICRWRNQPEDRPQRTHTRTDRARCEALAGYGESDGRGTEAAGDGISISSPGDRGCDAPGAAAEAGELQP